MRDRHDFASNFHGLREAAWAYASIASAVELGLLDHLGAPIELGELAARSGIEPGLLADTIGVLEAVGALEREGEVLTPTASFELYLSPSLRRVFEAEVRSDHLQTADVIRRTRERGGSDRWEHTDPLALISQGETGGLFGLVAECVLPALSGLGDRLAEPGVEFLDVGAGVGVIATELCRSFPELRAVGLEPHETARRIGLSRIAAAGLAERIELRPEPIEELREHERFDLAFIPQPFLAEAAFAAGLAAVHRALKPGGWLMVLSLDTDTPDELLAAARRFRAGVWGGRAISAERLAAKLRDSGYGEVRSDPPVGAFRCVNARRPLTAAVPVVGREADLRSAG